MASPLHTPSGHDSLHAEAARVAYLIAGFLRGTLTPQEHRELDRWVEQCDENMLLFEQLTEEVRTAETLRWAADVQGLAAPADAPARGKRPVPLRSYLLPAAACVLLLAGGWWAFFHRLSRTTAPAAGTAAAVAAAPPAYQRATLYTTGNPYPVTLSGRDTTLTLKGIGQLRVQNETLRYRAAGAPTAVHELRTAACATFGLVLPDSTRVWLSAGSRIRYPSGFGLRQRRVELQGEAYFEVAPEKGRPFTVHTESGQLQVLGTAFNVEAYGTSLTTTLLEGSLRVQGPQKSVVLHPGEQLRYTPALGWQKTEGADVAATLDWQSGLFLFREAPLSDVLWEIARWYGKEGTLKGSGAVHLTATIPRTLPLSRVLSLLEATGRVRFHLQGGTLQAEALPSSGR